MAERERTPPPDSLVALLSPQATGYSRPSSVAESDFNDVGLDDELAFSPVALSSGQSTASNGSLEGVTSRRTSLTLTASTTNHKKTASTTTIRSSRDVLISSPTTAHDESVSRVNRGSLDGQQRIQEEFARMQREKADFEDASGHAAIDWNFWGAVISDYQGFAAEQPERLAQAIAKGIPDTLRGMMWQHMAAAKDPELEAMYLRLLKESSPHERAITRDLGRTLPHHEFFTDGQGIGQENLFNVLKAYSLYDPQVGYCQGLPFVVATLLLNMPDEEAFSLLVRLMYVYDLRGHFLPEMPKLQMRLFQFDRLAEELLPVLHVHFLRQGVKSSMYCSQWFLTMFSYRFPLEIVYRIYDNCLASGIEAIFGFSITLLKKNEDLLLELKFDQILAFLSNQLFDRYKIPSENEDAPARYRVDEFVQDAVALRITPFTLDCYRHEYEEGLRKANQQAHLVDELRTSNRNLAAQVKRMETSLAQLNSEHVEVLNELVKARLRNEEIEEELVRYKLLYAEAMHENQDAQSSHRISIAQMLRVKRGSS